MQLPPAFHEDPTIRNTYIRALIAVSFHRATHENVRLLLEGSADLLTGCQFKQLSCITIILFLTLRI